LTISPEDRSERGSSLPDELTELLARVTRPGRYVGGEFNRRSKTGAQPRIVLSYPDVYEIGISNPGLQILYALINDGTSAVADRAYCPWPDMAAAMRASRTPLWTLETYQPVRDCDLWGFTLPHELTYTNILEMLDLAGVPLHAAERAGDDPIVLGGGPGVANPLPVAPFFDAFFIGEVEGRMGELVAALAAPTRAGRLQRLGDVPGVWVPAAARTGRVRRQVWMGFGTSAPVTEPLVPVLEAVHDRAVIEVMRGCTAGCRFCQAGVWYRPVRERPVDLVVEAAEKTLRSTGCDEVSLISLSSCDYTGIEEAVTRIRGLRPGVRVSLPSLRIDSAAVNLARLGSEQRGSVTLAPEAGTQELRDAINKGVDDAGFVEAVRAVFFSGFTGLKLYFMIGLPGEDDDGAAAIADMAAVAAAQARAIAKGRARLSVSVSSYVPKTHTPFESEPFAGEETLARRQRLIRAAMPRGVKLSFHDIGASVVEATLARSDAAAATLIEAAWRRGARFDGWTEHFDLGAWRAAALELGVELGGEGAFSRGALPWEIVDSGVEPAFFAAERERAARRVHTDDCRRGACGACGVCHDDVEMEVLS
jgi:radical SAM family uncharacterized protein